METSGYAIKAAVKRPADTSDYGTEASSITNQIPLLSENLTTKPELVISEAVVGNASIQDVDLAALSPAGTISTELWFEGLEYLWFAAFGYECPDPAVIRTAGTDLSGSPSWEAASSPDSFHHIFELDENLHREAWSSGERAASSTGDYVWTTSNQKVRTFSLAIDKGIGSPSVEHFVDCMVDRVTVKGAAGKPISVDWDLVARSRSFTGTSSSWTLPDYASPRPAIFPQVKFYATVPGATLATEIPISEFELSLENNLAGDDFDTGGNDASSGLSYRTEPVRDGQRRVSLRIKFARMNADTTGIRDWFLADTAVQAKLVITGPAISGSAYPFSYTFALPLAKVISANFPVAGPGVIRGDAELVGYKPTSTNYGYAWALADFASVKRKKLGELFLALENTRGSNFARDLNTAYPLP